MPTRIQVVDENALTLARVPCALAWEVIERLADLGVRATYSLRADQLLIYFTERDRAAAQRAMDRLADSPPTRAPADTPEPAARPNGWMAKLLVGRHL